IALLILAITITSPVLSVVLWCFALMGIWSYFAPFWALPNEFLTGSSAAVGIALINSIANIGGFFGPYSLGGIIKKTGSFSGGLAVAGISLLASATLVLMLWKRAGQDGKPSAVGSLANR